MRNWRSRRKGGGDQDSGANARAPVRMRALPAGGMAAITGDEDAAGMVLDAESTAESRSGVEFAFDTVQCPAAQHGMAACIAAIGMAESATQQAPTAGTVMTNARAETTNAVANRLVIDVLREITIERTPQSRSVFRLRRRLDREELARWSNRVMKSRASKRRRMRAIVIAGGDRGVWCATRHVDVHGRNCLHTRATVDAARREDSGGEHGGRCRNEERRSVAARRAIRLLTSVGQRLLAPRDMVVALVATHGG